MKSTSNSLRKTTLSLAILAASTVFVTQASAAGAPAPEAKQAKVTNPFSPAYGHEYRHGVVPTRQVHSAMKLWSMAHVQATGAETLSYGGGIGGVSVMAGQNKAYIVFWGTQWGTSSTDANGDLKFTGDTAGAAGAAQEMFKGIGTNNELWSADLTQWCNDAASGATSCASGDSTLIPYQQNILQGVWYDNSAAAPSAATGNQIGAEAVKAAAHFGNTTAASNRSAYYMILSPKGTNPDNYQGQYCAWHDYTGDSSLTGGAVSSPYGPLAFSNQPYNIDSGSGCGVGFVNSPGTLDGFTMTLGHEWHEMMSDQFPAGGLSNHGTGTYAGQENSDECAWIAAGSTGGAANVSFATGTFAEQASWSNDTNSCAISHAIVSGGGGGGSTPVANFTSSTSGLTATFTDSSTDTGATITAHSWTFGDGSTSTATSPSHTYAAAGTYTVVETVTDSLSHTASKTSSVTVSSGTGGNVLTNGVAVTGLAATTGNKLNYTMAVPAGATGLSFAISGGTGDADLYVKFGAAPTLTTYDCRPYITGNNETCNIATAQAGTYYVMLNSYASFTGVSLKGSYTAPGTGGTPTANFSSSVSGLTATFTDSSTDAGGTIGSHSWTFGDGSTSTTASPSHTYAAAGTYSVTETVTDSIDGQTSSKTASVTVTSGGGGCGGLVLCSGVAVALPATSTGSWTSIYTMQVLAGHTATFAISGGTPDADLYVKAGSAPTLSSYNCRPYTSTSTESCTFTPTTTTTYYIGVEAYQSFSGVSLKGTTN